jgi:hypothetical protein
MVLLGLHGGSLNTARYGLAGAGTQTAGLAFGGEIAPVTGATEEYDGSTWTTPGSLNTARYILGGTGIQTAALAFGGLCTPPNTGATEEYDGSSWTAGGSFKYCKSISTRRSRYSNSSISFWWLRWHSCLQEQLKNMMVQLGHL